MLVTDASPGMVEVARANIERAGLTDRLTAQRLDLVTDPMPEGRFDGAWAMLALHHVREVDRLLETVKELLNPGGWLAIVDLDDDRAGAFHADHADFTGHDGFDREAFAERLRRAVPGDSGVLLGGLVVGDDRALSDDLKQSFRETGMSHITAVSGSNLALVVVLLMAVGGPIGLRRRVVWLLAVTVAIWLYAAITGLEPPVVRAARP